MTPSQPPPEESGIKLREHVYDGIQEYDQRLPNWWLFTLYGAVIFWVVYWFAQVISGIAATDGAQVDAAMARVAAVKLASSIDVTNDEKFWEMAGNPVFVDAGKQTYTSLCAACHLASLRGKSESPTAVGPDLADSAWLHGGTPKEVFATVSKGVVTKGMPAWEPMLGQKKTAEVVAYLLRHHQKGEAITVEIPK
jgi:cytochrome c oxidase cbb3-type subunit 3